MVLELDSFISLVYSMMDLQVIQSYVSGEPHMSNIDGEMISAIVFHLISYLLGLS